MFMFDHKTFFLTYAWKHILVEYNQDQGKSFSFKDYLLYLLQADTWGDELCLCSVNYVEYEGYCYIPQHSSKI